VISAAGGASVEASAASSHHPLVVRDDFDSAPLTAAADAGTDEALRMCDSTSSGLTQEEAARRLANSGPNEIASERPVSRARRLLHALRNPLVILLSVLAALSLGSGDVRSASVIALMIVLGVALRFIQEARADASAAALRAMIHVTVEVRRDGEPREIPLRDVVPGDVVIVAANHSDFCRPSALAAIVERAGSDCLIVDPWNCWGAAQVFAYASELAVLTPDTTRPPR